MKTLNAADANIAVVQNLYAAVLRGDLQAVLAGVTPDIDWQALGPAAEFPAFAPFHGTAGVEQFFRTIGEAHTINEFTPETYLASGDTVVCLGRYVLTFKRSGRKIACEWAMAFTFRDGKVARFREFTDSAMLAAAYRG